MAGSNENAQLSEREIEPLITDEQVREYLKNNQDFLERHPDMLDYLHISHATGSAVSLVEKQASVLRERNVEMRHRLNTLSTNARDNDHIFAQTRVLVLKLLDAESTRELSNAYQQSMLDDFGVEQASLIFYGDESEHPGCRCVTFEEAEGEIGALIREHKPVCGPLRKEELKFLFPESGEVGSAALVPLFRDEPLGVIAIGSSDAGRYSSTMGTLFLSHIAEVVVRLLTRLPLASK